MGTTRIKVIDLSSDQKEIKTSRKHAEKLAGPAKIKKAEKQPKESRPNVNHPITEKIKEAQEVSLTGQDIEAEKVEKIDAAQEAKTQDSSAISATSTKKRLHHKGKKYKNAKKLVEDKVYSAKEALALLPQVSITKFDAAVEVHVSVTDKNLKTKVSLPYPVKGGKQKEKKYLVFSDLSSKAFLPSVALAKDGAKEEKPMAKDEKHIIAGDEKTIAEIETGKIKPGKDFDVVLATPKFMPSLAKIAKILGPRGLMPNPKAGTVLDDVQKYFSQNSDGATEFKTDPTAPVIHAKIGKLSQGEKELQDNLKALILGIGPAKIQKAILKSTMSPAIKLDITSL